MVETVNFDVGGKKYRVSKSQIDLHPNTMIAKLVSDQWRQDAENEIFIDRDGTLFQSVLNYLRDGKVYLPFIVSKAALMNELVYFGFEDVDESSVEVDKAPGALAITAYKHGFDALNEVSKKACNDGDCSYVAGWMIQQYLRSTVSLDGFVSLLPKEFMIHLQEEKEIWSRVERIRNSPESVEKINGVLIQAGLAITEFYNPRNNVSEIQYVLKQTEEQKAEPN